MKSRNSGWALVGFDLNSGWNWTATNQGWSRPLHDLDDRAVGADPGGDQPVFLECLAVGVVELVAMAVPLVDRVDARRPRGPGCPGPGRRATSPAAWCRRARGPTAALPSAQMTGWSVVWIELGAVGVLEPEHVAGELDDGALHAQANAEVGDRCASWRSGSPRSCPRSRACRSRRGRGCRRRPPGCASAPRLSTSSASTRTTSTRVRLAIPA